MIKNKLYPYIEKYINEYLWGFSKEQLNVGVMNGTIVLEKLNIRVDKVNQKFDVSDMPFWIKSGSIEKIQVYCSLMNFIGEKPLEISIDNIDIILCPSGKWILRNESSFIKENDHHLKEPYDPLDNNFHDVFSKKVNLYDGSILKKNKKLIEFFKDKSKVSELINKLLNTALKFYYQKGYLINLKVKNVHFRFEDDLHVHSFLKPGIDESLAKRKDLKNRIGIGLTVQELEMSFSADGNIKKNNFKVDNLNVYYHNNSEIYIPLKTFFENLDADLNISEKYYDILKNSLQDFNKIINYLNNSGNSGNTSSNVNKNFSNSSTFACKKIIEKFNFMGNFGISSLDKGNIDFFSKSREKNYKFYFQIATSELKIELNDFILNYVKNLFDTMRANYIVESVQDFKPMRKPYNKSDISVKNLLGSDLKETFNKKRKMIVRDWLHYFIWFSRFKKAIYGKLNQNPLQEEFSRYYNICSLNAAENSSLFSIADVAKKESNQTQNTYANHTSSNSNLNPNSNIGSNANTNNNNNNSSSAGGTNLSNNPTKTNNTNVYNINDENIKAELNPEDINILFNSDIKIKSITVKLCEAEEKYDNISNLHLDYIKSNAIYATLNSYEQKLSISKDELNLFSNLKQLILQTEKNKIFIYKNLDEKISKKLQEIRTSSLPKAIIYKNFSKQESQLLTEANRPTSKAGVYSTTVSNSGIIGAAKVSIKPSNPSSFNQIQNTETNYNYSNGNINYNNLKFDQPFARNDYKNNAHNISINNSNTPKGYGLVGYSNHNNQKTADFTENNQDFKHKKRLVAIDQVLENIGASNPSNININKYKDDESSLVNTSRYNYKESKKGTIVDILLGKETDSSAPADNGLRLTNKNNSNYNYNNNFERENNYSNPSQATNYNINNSKYHNNNMFNDNPYNKNNTNYNNYDVSSHNPFNNISTPYSNYNEYSNSNYSNNININNNSNTNTIRLTIKNEDVNPNISRSPANLLVNQGANNKNHKYNNINSNNNNYFNDNLNTKNGDYSNYNNETKIYSEKNANEKVEYVSVHSTLNQGSNAVNFYDIFTATENALDLTNQAKLLSNSNNLSCLNILEIAKFDLQSLNIENLEGLSFLNKKTEDRDKDRDKPNEKEKDFCLFFYYQKKNTNKELKEKHVSSINNKADTDIVRDRLIFCTGDLTINLSNEAVSDVLKISRKLKDLKEVSQKVNENKTIKQSSYLENFSLAGDLYYLRVAMLEKLELKLNDMNNPTRLSNINSLKYDNFKSILSNINKSDIENFHNYLKAEISNTDKIALEDKCGDYRIEGIFKSISQGSLVLDANIPIVTVLFYACKDADKIQEYNNNHLNKNILGSPSENERDKKIYKVIARNKLPRINLYLCLKNEYCLVKCLDFESEFLNNPRQLKYQISQVLDTITTKFETLKHPIIKQYEALISAINNNNNNNKNDIDTINDMKVESIKNFNNYPDKTFTKDNQKIFNKDTKLNDLIDSNIKSGLNSKNGLSAFNSSKAGNNTSSKLNLLQENITNANNFNSTLSSKNKETQGSNKINKNGIAPIDKTGLTKANNNKPPENLDNSSDVASQNSIDSNNINSNINSINNMISKNMASNSNPINNNNSHIKAQKQTNIGKTNTFNSNINNVLENKNNEILNKINTQEYKDYNKISTNDNIKNRNNYNYNNKLDYERKDYREDLNQLNNESLDRTVEYKENKNDSNKGILGREREKEKENQLLFSEYLITKEKDFDENKNLDALANRQLYSIVDKDKNKALGNNNKVHIQTFENSLEDLDDNLNPHEVAENFIKPKDGLTNAFSSRLSSSKTGESHSKASNLHDFGKSAANTKVVEKFGFSDLNTKEKEKQNSTKIASIKKEEANINPKNPYNVDNDKDKGISRTSTTSNNINTANNNLYNSNEASRINSSKNTANSAANSKALNETVKKSTSSLLNNKLASSNRSMNTLESEANSKKISSASAAVPTALMSSVSQANTKKKEELPENLNLYKLSNNNSNNKSSQSKVNNIMKSKISGKK